MKVYYSRPVSLYNTLQEKRDFELLSQMGFEIFDPNKKELEEKYKIEGMKVYLDIINDCDLVAFRSFPDMKISAGVMKEINEAIRQNKPVFELPTLTENRLLNVNDTRNYLKYLGFR